ncbi:alpha/beta fold hydrolase, partial [Bacillus anthracis]|uniref:alpha/beta fold hydrolase n=1 Tax=Bacillus anthracis TaxID=1392 RepID=UPI0039A48B06
MNSIITISSDNALLATEIVGAGEPVVFLHANVCDRRMWQEQMRSIGATHKAIAYDRRGFGQTVSVPESFSGLADLLAVLDAVVEGRPAILIGCSLGGRIALDVALHHPARVRALILVAPNVTGAPNPTYTAEVQALVVKANEVEASRDLTHLSRIKARLWLDGPLASEGRVAGTARILFHEMYGTAMRS